MLLIHGSSSNSAAWMGDVPELSKSYRTYCVDIPGEPGGSEVIRHDLQYPEKGHLILNQTGEVLSFLGKCG